MNLARSEDYFKQGCELAIENANRLSKIAKVAAQEGEFSVACSLSILAAEEAVKASFLLVKQYGKGENLDDYDKIFRDHKTKHKHLPDTSNLFEFLVGLLYTEHGIFKYLFDMLDRYADKLTEEQKPAMSNFRKALLIILDRVQKTEDKVKVNIEDSKKWWKQADLLKMRGFYVDDLKVSWHDPKIFTEEKFKEVLFYTSPLIENISKLKEIFEKSITN